ncbi:hypothetical protein MRB53_005656 [Persea americana]|uniref:Uncharacterized protein n=1 Tax=Persea americana TaxID=3435 RepID=A0ACC2MEH3_PERAE|nr:hypothetical protein MRB53_005656 [Persea americana]
MELGLDALKRRTPVDKPIELGPTNTEDLYRVGSASATESQSKGDSRNSRGSQSKTEERSTPVGRSLDMDETIRCSCEQEKEKINSFEKEKRQNRWSLVGEGSNKKENEQINSSDFVSG